MRLSWLVFSRGFPVPQATLVYKRLMSIVLSAAALLISLPVMLLVAIAIKLDSRGPVIYVDRRVGVGEREFGMWKFRTMVLNADDPRLVSA